MCLHRDHICSNICMTMGLHECQYCTCIHLKWYSSDFEHNGEADNSSFVSMYVYALDVQKG